MSLKNWKKWDWKYVVKYVTIVAGFFSSELLFVYTIISNL